MFELGQGGLEVSAGEGQLAALEDQVDCLTAGRSGRVELERRDPSEAGLGLVEAAGEAIEAGPR